MAGYKVILLSDILNAYKDEPQKSESIIKSLTSKFSCPLNKDVETFLKDKAIVFAKQQIAPTYFVLAEYKGRLELVGYFTLTIKSFLIKKAPLSSTLAKRIRKFGTYDSGLKSYVIPAPLIAQLGKNYTDGLNNLITGAELLDLACNKVREIHRMGGGKIVYVECEDKPALVDFYTKYGFVEFGKRTLEGDEKDDITGDYYIQLLRYIE